MSEFNRDGDSFRSHISNKYFPVIDDALYPSESLRNLEVKANLVFEEYKKLYISILILVIMVKDIQAVISGIRTMVDLLQHG